MTVHATKPQTNKDRSGASVLPKPRQSAGGTFQFADNRPEAVVARQRTQMMTGSPQVKQLMAYQAMADNSPVVQRVRHLWMLDSDGGEGAFEKEIEAAKEAHLNKIQEVSAFRNSEFGKLMIELGIGTIEKGKEFKDKMDVKDYSLSDLKVFVQGTRGLIPAAAKGNVDELYKILAAWLRSAITGRPKDPGKLEGKKERFGKEPHHFVRVDDFKKGVLEFTIRTTNPNVQKQEGAKYGLERENGRSLFAKVMAFYGAAVHTIKAKWVSTNDKLTDNLETYKKRLQAGDSQRTAALKTFTGKMAVEFGFTVVQGPEAIPSGVSFQFQKPLLDDSSSSK